MTARLVWLIGGSLLALPLASIVIPAETPVVLKLLVSTLLLLSALQPFWGLAALAAIGPLVVPLTILSGQPPWGGNETLEALVLATTAGIALRWAATGPPARGRLGRPALVLGAIIAASALTLLSVQQLAVAPVPQFLKAVWQQATYDYFLYPRTFPAWHDAAIWIEGLVLAVMIERVARSRPGGAWALAGVAAAGLAVESVFSLLRLVQVVGRSDDLLTALWRHSLSTRISPHFPDVNAMGSYFAMGAVVWVSRAIAPSTSALGRVGSVVAVVLVMTALWLTGSRAAQAATVAGCLLALWALYRPSGRVLVGWVVLVGLGAATLVAASPSRSAQSGFGASLGVRRDLAGIGLQLTQQAPLFGIGIGEFRSASTALVSADLIARFPQARVGENAHNQLIQVLAELGVAGAAALIWLLTATVWPARHTLTSRGAPAHLAHAAGWTAGVVALLCSSLFGHPWLTPFVLVHSLAALGLVAALTPAPESDSPHRSPRRSRLVVLTAMGVLAISLPIRITAARANADLDHRLIGASAVMGERDGVPYRLADPISTWFVRTTALVVEIPLRADAGGACSVTVDVDRKPANHLQVTDDAWQTVRFSFIEPETRWNSRRIDVKVVDGSCQLLVGRFGVVD